MGGAGLRLPRAPGFGRLKRQERICCLAPRRASLLCVKRRAYLLSFLIAVLAVVGGCASESEELWRITSPDSRVDAVFIQVGGGGATVGFSYQLFIVPRGAKPNTTGELLLADKIGNVSAVWSKPRKLEIRYDQARIFSFVNFWQSKDVDNFKYVVEVQLVPSGPSQLGDIYK